MEASGKIIPKMKGNKNDMALYNYLRDCRYQVRAHFIFNKNHPECRPDWNEKKHLEISKRMIEKGGRQDIFLGTRECQGYVKPCKFGEGIGFFDNYGDIPLTVPDMIFVVLHQIQTNIPAVPQRDAEMHGWYGLQISVIQVSAFGFLS